MLPKLALAFALGGTAVGLVVYLGMKKTPEVPPPAPVVAMQPAATVAVPVSEVAPEPAPAAPPASAPRPAAAKPKATVAARSKPAPAASAEAPIPAPAPYIPVIAKAPEPEAMPAPKNIPDAAPSPKAEEHKPAPAPREAKTITIPAGTLVTVRLREALNTEKNSADDNFQATLDTPLIVDGLVIAERGSLQRGRIVELARAGRVKGNALLAIQLNELNTSDGQKVAISTDTFRREGESSMKGDLAKTGVAAGIGAAIGAIAGGGKGAAIGAGIGGAAGAGTAMATRGKPANLPSETRISFRITEAVTLTEKIN